MSLEQWAIGRQKEMYSLWADKLQEEFPKGFEISTSPILENPKVVIIGRNPAGSGEEHMERFSEPNSEFGFYSEHDYAPEGDTYTIANKMRNIVFKNNLSLLDSSIETNRHFLRTANSNIHDGKLQKLRNAGREEIVNRYESICHETVGEFIRRGDPDLVVSFNGYSDNNKYPIDEMEEFYRFDLEIEEQYQINRKNRNKKGNLTSTEFRITHADEGSFQFLGFTPHLSTPNIPGIIRELMTEVADSAISSSLSNSNGHC